MARIAAAGSDIDELALRAQGVREDIRLRVERWVDVLRQREADIRMSARIASDGGRDGWDAAAASLDRAVDEIDVQIAIASAQLDLDDASDGASFERAVERQLDAYRAYVDLRGTAEHRADPPTPDADAVDAVRDRTAAAADRLERFRVLRTEVSDSLKTGVLTALDDLDREQRREFLKASGPKEGRERWE